MLQSERLLFIQKGCPKKVIPENTSTFCITNLVDKKVISKNIYPFLPVCEKVTNELYP